MFISGIAEAAERCAGPTGEATFFAYQSEGDSMADWFARVDLHNRS